MAKISILNDNPDFLRLWLLPWGLLQPLHAVIHPFLLWLPTTRVTVYVQRRKGPRGGSHGCTWECSSCTRSLASSSSCSDSLRVRSVCSRAAFISSSSSSSRPLLRSVMASCSLRSSLLRRASSSCSWESCRGKQGWGRSPQVEGPTTAPAPQSPHGHLELALDCAQVLLGLRQLAVGVAQLDLHLIEVSLHLLLQP